MADLAEIDSLRQQCEDYQLFGRDILDRFTLSELAEKYNGAGPDSWLPEAREILTKAMSLFKPVVLIHDIQFAQSDGSDEGFEKTVSDWCSNTRKILTAEYPLWTWRLLDKNFRRELAYWTSVMKTTNLAISTASARRAWIAAYKRRSQKHA